MTEEELQASILGKFVPTHNVSLGSAFGKVLENPRPYRVPGGYQLTVNGERFGFGEDVMEPCLALMDHDRGLFEVKATKEYDDVTVVAVADQIVGARLIEHKTSLSTFDVEKYLDSYQWRFMTDIFQPSIVTYLVFSLFESRQNGVIELRDVHSFNVFPYPELHTDCCALLGEFVAYVRSRGLDGVLRQRQIEAA